MSEIVFKYERPSPCKGWLIQDGKQQMVMVAHWVVEEEKRSCFSLVGFLKK